VEATAWHVELSGGQAPEAEKFAVLKLKNEVYSKFTQYLLYK